MLDALFYDGGMRSGFSSTLGSTSEVMFLPIDGNEAEPLRASTACFSPMGISSNAYRYASTVVTLAVSAQRITHKKAALQLVSLAKKLFSLAALTLVQASCPNAQLIGTESSVQGSGLPLQPSA